MVDLVEHGAGDQGQEGGHLVETTVVVAEDEEGLEVLLVECQVDPLEEVGDGAVGEDADEGEAIQVDRQEGSLVEVHQQAEPTHEVQDGVQGQETRRDQILVAVSTEGH